MKVGVLALQGAVREHIQLLSSLDVEGIAIKHSEVLKDVDGLIIPGGESTTMRKLMDEYQLIEPIIQFHEQRKPIFGTCAGLILLAKNLEETDVVHLGLLDVTVKRNAFGRQRESFEASLDMKEVGPNFLSVFIRAPYISSVGEGVTVLATLKEDVVAVRQRTLLGASFHPELTSDSRFHAYFVSMIKESLSEKGK